MKKKNKKIYILLLLVLFILLFYFRNLILLKKFTTFSVDNYSKYHLEVHRFNYDDLYNSNELYKYNEYYRLVIDNKNIYYNNYEDTMIIVENNVKEIQDKYTMPQIQTFTEFVHLATNSTFKKYLIPLRVFIIPTNYNNQSAYKISFFEMPIITWYIDAKDYSPIACKFNNTHFQYKFSTDITLDQVIYIEKSDT